MSVTNAVLVAIKDHLVAEFPTTFTSVEVVEGTPIENIVRGPKGLQCYLHYRSEKPIRKDGAGAHFMRGMLIAVSLVRTLSGKSRTLESYEDLNDVMDSVLDTVVQPGSVNRWWGSDPNICGLGPNGITAIAAPNNDFVGRILLFNVLVR